MIATDLVFDLADWSLVDIDASADGNVIAARAWAWPAVQNCQVDCGYESVMLFDRTSGNFRRIELGFVIRGVLELSDDGSTVIVDCSCAGSPLWAIETDSGTARRLDSTASDSTWPKASVSADGSKILKHADGKLFVIDTAADTEIHIDLPGYVYEAKMSGDGSTAAVEMAEIGVVESGVYTVDLETLETTMRVPGRLFTSFELSFDGSVLVHSHPQPTHLNLASGVQTFLPADEATAISTIDLSADGDLVAFLTQDALSPHDSDELASIVESHQASDDIYLWNVETGAITFASARHDLSSRQAQWHRSPHLIGNDDSQVLYLTDASDIPGGDLGKQSVVRSSAFRRDLLECNGRSVTVALMFGEAPTAGDDVILGTAHDDTIDGGAGDDVICGSSGADTISGSGGDDIIVVGEGDDFADGGPGNDQFIESGHPRPPAMPSCTFYSNRLWGGSGNDLVVGTGTLRGGWGDDTVTGAAVILDGGDGNDTILPTEGCHEIHVDGGNGDDFLSDEKIEWNPSRVVPATILGGDGHDSIYWLNSDHHVLGGPGDDNIRGPASVDGGTGDDRIAGSANAIGGEGDDTLLGTGGNDHFTGGPGNDVLRGRGGSDMLIGGDGLDDVRGGPGRDTLDGGPQDDQLHGGAGRDLMIGGDGDDTMRGDRGADEMFGGDGNDRIRGGLGYDELFGEEGNDILGGSKGHDQLSGGTGDDLLRGGKGVDRLNGGDGTDICLDVKSTNRRFCERLRR